MSYNWDQMVTYSKKSYGYDSTKQKNISLIHAWPIWLTKPPPQTSHSLQTQMETGSICTVMLYAMHFINGEHNTLRLQTCDSWYSPVHIVGECVSNIWYHDSGGLPIIT